MESTVLSKSIVFIDSNYSNPTENYIQEEVEPSIASLLMILNDDQFETYLPPLYNIPPVFNPLPDYTVNPHSNQSLSSVSQASIRDQPSHGKWKQKPQKVQKNTKERHRRSQMSNSINLLRELVPQCANSEKINHNTIMAYTVNHIRFLKKTIKQLEMENKSLKAIVPPSVISQIQQHTNVQMSNIVTDIEDVGSWPLHYNLTI